jgi:predicted metal-dependent phosphoesterase TrpH
MKKHSLIFSLLLLILIFPSFSQKAKKISIPDIPHYLTLKGDFHLHTVFSDGLVWPTVRIDEAVNEGIDIIAVTDHIEYRPHLKDIPSDYNRSYDIEKPYTEKHNIILVKGAEITRSMPPGHFNALFITNADSLAKEDFKEAVREAKKQGGFIMWNHPGWKAQQPDTIQWFNIHTWLYENGLMNGIEIYNDHEYYIPVFDWALKKKLTIFANSDSHSPIGYSFDLVNSHRPVTLVFAKERTLESVKEALMEGRTAAFTENMVRGREEWLRPLFNSCVEVSRKGKSISLNNKSDIEFEIEDNTGTMFTLEAKGSDSFNSNKKAVLKIKNFEIAPGKCLQVVVD